MRLGHLPNPHPFQFVAFFWLSDESLRLKPFVARGARVERDTSSRPDSESTSTAFFRTSGRDEVFKYHRIRYQQPKGNAEKHRKAEPSRHDSCAEAVTATKEATKQRDNVEEEVEIVVPLNAHDANRPLVARYR